MRSLLLALPCLAALAAPLPCLAQSATSAQHPATSASRGRLAVVGLRAPDGDADVASALSSAIREVARAAGYDVPDNTSAFDQEAAMVGCSGTSPECLALIATDIQSPRFVHGVVQRTARNREAPLNVDITLWDDDAHTIVHHESFTFPRPADVSAATLRDVAQQVFAPIASHDPAGQSGVRSGAQGTRATAVQPNPHAVTVPTTPTTPTEPSHLRRWVGVGLLSAGAVLGAIGAWQWASSNGQGDDAAAGAGTYGAAWVRYDNAVNRPVNGVRLLSPDAVCERAAADAGSNPDAAGVRQLCDSNSTSRVVAWALGLTGLALVGAGATLVILDATDDGARREGSRTPGHARLRVTPLVDLSTRGAAMTLTF